jgi:spore coat polysaccharide biosynthesis protein SpsF
VKDAAAMRTGVIVAARTGSSRLPNKALFPLLGVPSLSFLLRRLKSSRLADVVMVATTDDAEDDVLEELAEREGAPVFRGHPRDLIARYVAAAQWAGLDRVARITADCPFVDGALVDHCLLACDGARGWDVASTKGAFPVGLDCEIYRAETMRAVAASGDLTEAHREHLTLYLYDHPESYAKLTVAPPDEWRRPGVYTLDDRADYERLRRQAAALGRVDFSIAELARLEG